MTNPTSMVTKVAHAIEAAGIEWCENSDLSDPGFSDVPEEVFARAAILALREPSEEVITAGWKHSLISGTESGCYDDHHPKPEDSWELMIDAILAEDAGK